MAGVRWLVLVLVSATSGCALLGDDVRRDVMPLDGTVCLEATQRSVAPRPVYWDWQDPPKRAFRRIARIEVSGPGSTETLVRELVAQAAACGATAVIDVDKEHTVEVVDHWFQADDEDVYPKTIVSGTAVRWVDLEDGPPAREVHGWDE